MADYFTGYANPVQQTSLADMMNLASGVQNYQQAQQMNPLALQAKQLELQQNQQLLQQRQLEYKKLQETYGPDVARVIAESQRAGTEANVAAQTAQPRIATAGSQASTAESQAKSAGIKVDTDTAERFIKMHEVAAGNLLPIATKKDASYQDLVDSMTKTLDALNVPEDVRKQSMAQIPVSLKNASASKIQSFAAQEASKSLSAKDRFESFVPTPKIAVSPEGRTVTTTTGAFATPTAEVGIAGGTQINNYEATGKTDVNGNPTAFVKDATGKILGEVTIPAGVNLPKSGVTPGMMKAPPSTVPSNVPTRIPAGETAETMKTLQDERQMAKTSAQSVAPALNNIDTVLRYLPLAQTGKMGEALAGLQSIVGTTGGSKPEELAASARDIIQKSIDDLALQKNAALGGKFAADLQAAQTTLANAPKNPTAIAKSMQQLQPLIQHSLNYQVGLEKAIEGSQSIFSKRQYDNDMIKTYDPVALQMNNAFKSGNVDGLNKFIKENKISETQKATLIKKLEQYSNLVNTGNINGR